MSSQKRIELNCDMGESLGRWKLADDEGIMPFIDAANVAAGFHASDPTTIHKTVKLAKQHSVMVGAHPGFPDLVGFGRRPMQLSAEEVHDIILYQTGAVWAFCQAEGVKLSHVKPHGALYFYLLSSKEVCQAAIRAIKTFGVPFYGLPNTLHEEIAKELNVPFVPEFFADIDYTAEGQLLPPSKSKKATPTECAERVKHVLTDSDPLTAHFKERKYFSVCLHSDMEGAEENVRAVRAMIDTLNKETA
ncbi:hypothetical protein CBS101457_003314 [Exobasidium rhododendri]|nr:hypothetical protein CBS101457_003314 [Exobasidium rhododendri]